MRTSEKKRGGEILDMKIGKKLKNDPASNFQERKGKEISGVKRCR